MDKFANEILHISLEEEMCNSYIGYAMSVIVGRALPDVRDGLKPVHRRIFYAMHELNNYFDNPYKKSARVVGNVIGKYHPHGDSALYETIVRMAQKFSLRYVLVDGQGNFGSIDGDNAAAMRYTEIRMSKICSELLFDIDKKTVDFQLNYDGSENEPVILPSRIPNLLINGSSGIAVGLATNIPPHNLNEIINACCLLLKKPNSSINDILKIVPAPDFPTSGIIYGLESVHCGYKTGKGKVIIRALTHFEFINKNNINKSFIVIDELPYQVNKQLLLERFSKLINEKKIIGISSIIDESDKNGMRIVIQIKRNEDPYILLNNLYKYTQLQNTFGINMVALVNNKPKLLNLKEAIEFFLSYRREIVIRRSIFELRKSYKRKHILEGFFIVIYNINDFIEIIKNSNTFNVAMDILAKIKWKFNLIDVIKLNINKDLKYSNEFSSEDMDFKKKDFYILSKIQIKEILQMRLQSLISFEKNKIIDEYKNLIIYIDYLLGIINVSSNVTNILINEFLSIKKRFGDSRRSKIIKNMYDVRNVDLINSQNMVVIISNNGYIKSQVLSEYNAQKRGGRGKRSTKIKDNDLINSIFIANTHDYVLCFSDRGKVYWLMVYNIPQSSRISKGLPIVNLLPLNKYEKITSMLPIQEFSDNKFILMATSFGIVKKTSLKKFSRPFKKGIIAIDLKKNDYLIGSVITNGKCDVMLFSDSGKAVRFSENDVRSVGRDACGVKGMSICKNSRVISILVSDNNEKSVLIATENGYGKRTSLKEYTCHSRGTKGVISIKTSSRNGKLISAILVNSKSQVMLITSNGTLIRFNVSEIRKMSRVAQGVMLINLDNKNKLSALQNII